MSEKIRRPIIARRQNWICDTGIIQAYNYERHYETVTIEFDRRCHSDSYCTGESVTFYNIFFLYYL